MPVVQVAAHMSRGWVTDQVFSVPKTWKQDLRQTSRQRKWGPQIATLHSGQRHIIEIEKLEKYKEIASLSPWRFNVRFMLCVGLWSSGECLFVERVFFFLLLQSIIAATDI